MSTLKPIVFAAVAAGAVAALLVPGRARAEDRQEPPRPLRIGIFNLKDCGDPAKYDYARDLRKDLGAAAKAFEEDLARIRDKSVKLKEILTAIEDKNSSLFMDKYLQFKLAESEYEMVKKIHNSSILSKSAGNQNLIYLEARRVIAQVAQEMKLDLVLRVEEQSGDDDSPEMVAQRNLLRTVLYHDPALDITPKVLAKLNEDYRKKNPAGVEYECKKCKMRTKLETCPTCGAKLKS
jgi:Skp family chaperone for outer membrane proteins